jgi:HEAT repeat protein
MTDTPYRPTDPPANGFPHQAPGGDELFPPVEPPPAGFILKLFVIPALIVMVLLAVWQVPKWLVRQTTARPDELIQRLEHGSAIARNQNALDLANYLRDERFIEFRRSPQSAQQLAKVLERQIEQSATAASATEDEIRFRTYLVRALGEFEVQDGINVLLKVAVTNRNPSEQVVRDAALHSIAVRAYNLRQLDPPRELTHLDLEPTLIRLAGDEDPQIRKATAYTLGVLGTPPAIAQLEKMVGDPHADTRYNAAVWLADRGNAAAIDTLAEMLELQDLDSAQEESNPQDRAFKRAVIVSNAVKATQKLAEQNSSADFAPLIAALEQLAAADEAALEKARIPIGVIPEVQRTLKQLRRK